MYKEIIGRFSNFEITTKICKNDIVCVSDFNRVPFTIKFVGFHTGLPTHYQHRRELYINI